MDFKSIAKKREGLATLSTVTQMPALDAPVAGVQWTEELATQHPERVVAVQIALTQRNDKLAGAAVDTLNGKAHRLEVTRMGNFNDVSEDEYLQSALKWRIAAARECDGVLRPTGRHSLLMELGGPPGLKTLKSWTKAYSEVRRGVEWAKEALDVERGATQYALIIVADITPWTTKSWVDARGNRNSFREAKILGIGHLELVKLSSPEAAPTTPEGDDDDFIGGFDD